jgi:pantetheine-phosphate adenylyltransferase
MTSAFYPGSFDPVTFGHLDIAGRAARLFDRLVVGVGAHHGKTPLFSAEERLVMMREELSAIAPGAALEFALFDDLAVTAARRHGASVVIRGLRDATDFDYEMQMAGMNSAMEAGIETVFLPSSGGVRHVAGRFVRQIAAMGGDVSNFVPAAVAARLTQRFRT